MTDIVPVEASPIVAPAVSPEDMVRQMELFQKLKAQLLDPKTDVCSIKGKPFVKRSGWRKLALAFNISDEIVSTEKEEGEDWFTWRIQVRAWAPNGRSAVGIGACSSREREFAHLDHDVYAIAHTRAKNRAISDLIGSGEVSAEEMRATKTVSDVSNGPHREDGRRFDKNDPYPEIGFKLRQSGLDQGRLNIYPYGKKLYVNPLEELGPDWQGFDEALAPLGARWIDEAGRWEIDL